MDAVFGLLGILLFVLGLAMTAVNAIRKRSIRMWGVLVGAGFLLFLVGIVLSPSGDDSPPSVPESASQANTSTSRSQAALVPPTSTAVPTPTPTFEEQREFSLSIAYDDLFRNNEAHVGKVVYYKGKIAQVNSRRGDKYLLRVNITEGTYGFWDDDVRLDYEGTRVLEDDLIEFIGRVDGLWEYKAVLGNARTIPHLTALELRLVQDLATLPTITPVASSTPASTPMQSENLPPVPTLTLVPTPTATPEPIKIAGRGQQASTKFDLNQGLAIFRMTHDGKSNFIIVLLDDRGNRVTGLVNEIGPFDGSKAVGIENSGSYLLNISADGNWKVTIEQ